MIEWRGIPGYAGYEASSDGRVRRIRECLNGWRPRELTGYIALTGYRTLGLMIDGRKMTVHVHRLVTIAFHGPPPTPAHEVAHSDGDPLNNRIDNLRWATRAENAADRRRHGRDSFGAVHGMSKLTDDHVRHIFRLACAGVGQRDIADRFGVHQATVHRIYAGKGWKHLALARRVA